MNLVTLKGNEFNVQASAEINVECSIRNFNKSYESDKTEKCYGA